MTRSQSVENSVVQDTNLGGSLQEVLHSLTTLIREQVDVHDVIREVESIETQLLSKEVDNSTAGP